MPVRETVLEEMDKFCCEQDGMVIEFRTSILGLNDDDARSMSFFLTKKAALPGSFVCSAAVIGSSDKETIEMFAQ